MRHRGMRGIGIALIAAALGLALETGAVRAGPPVTFTHGVASGDVTPFSAVLWTRVDQGADLQLEVAIDLDFHVKHFQRTVHASAQHDFTAKVLAAPLRPNQVYFYRWRHGWAASDVGTFKTAPFPWASANVKFTWSGDSDGTKVGGVPFFNHFETLDRARLEDPDFFIYLGDTIYADSEVRAAPATSLDEFRDTYKLNREFAALRNLLKNTSTYAIWDDHEVRDDFAGQTVDLTLFANGREAFLEYMPILELRLPDPGCAGNPLFRVFGWGKDVELIILDERACRSAEVKDVCSFAPGILDLAPTMPGALRALFPQFLAPAPPPGCLAAIFDPSRTMLGRVQKTLFKEVLLHSKAKFKFVINEVAMHQHYILPYDRWEGYSVERAEILNFIRSNHIPNVIFLTTDDHMNLITDLFIDRFLDPEPIAHEFLTGPIAQFTAEEIILKEFGPVVGPQAVGAVQGILSLVGVACRHLNKFSYGVVDVDAGAGTATITLKDDTGEVISDQLNPNIRCTMSVGP